MITRLEELVMHLQERDGWFAALREIADATELLAQSQDAPAAQVRAGLIG
jgi:hypothetical protein